MYRLGCAIVIDFFHLTKWEVRKHQHKSQAMKVEATAGDLVWCRL